MSILVIIPAFNEGKVISKVIAGVKAEIPKNENCEILVIDDGSADDTRHKAEKEGVKVIRHLINRGLGGALGTGFDYAKRHDFDIAVTFDADGQHDAKDLKKVVDPILKNQADIVIGSRALKGWKSIPWDRKLIIFLSNIITQLFFGISTTDSQSGFRAFSKKAYTRISIKTQKMEVSSELFSEIKRLNLKIKEVPIKVYYTPYSRKKGQSNLNAVSVLARLILRLSR